MKKKWIPAMLLTLCIVLAVNFIIFVIIDACTFDAASSLPFIVHVLIRALEFVLPSAALLIAAVAVLRKQKKEADAEA